MWHERGTIVGVFTDRTAAIRAVDDLRQRGFRPEQVGLLTPGESVSHFLAESTPTEATEGAERGLVGGGVLGGLAGWLLGLAAVTIPGAAPLIVAGPLVGLLEGIGVGVGAGGIFGALIGIGVPDPEASWYERRVREGATLVLVQAPAQSQEARAVLLHHGADSTRTDAELGVPGPAFGDTAGGILAAHHVHPLRVHDAQPGWPVHAADGRQIGVVEQIEGPCLVVLGGSGRLFIPFREVGRVEGSAIYLGRKLDEIPYEAWSAPPKPTPSDYEPGAGAEPDHGER